MLLPCPGCGGSDGGSSAGSTEAQAVVLGVQYQLDEVVIKDNQGESTIFLGMRGPLRLLERP